jgi:ribosome-associated protein
MKFVPPYLHHEFKYKVSRSGGAGGQNVNKVATKVQIDFDIKNSQLITESDKILIISKLENKLIQNEILQVTAQTERTQLGNKLIAIKKIYAILNKCFLIKKHRKESKPTKTSIEKRLTEKKKLSERKRNRNPAVNLKEI